MRREQRIRRTLENEIVNTSVAISRWQQEEINAELANRGRMHLGHLQHASTVPVMEIQWLAALVPYEALSFNSEVNQQGPLLYPNFPGNPAEQEHARLSKAIDLLLHNWTTLNQPAGPRIEDITSQTSRGAKSRPTMTTAGQKTSSISAQSTRPSKAVKKLAGPKKSEFAADKPQDDEIRKISKSKSKKSGLDSSNIESTCFSHLESASSQPKSPDTTASGVETAPPSIPHDTGTFPPLSEGPKGMTPSWGLCALDKTCPINVMLIILKRRF